MNTHSTLEDVARHAGVSRSTVSLVCRNSPLVAQATRERVENAMAAVGYIYNRKAANMRSASSGLVGLLLPDLANPVFAEVISGVESVLEPQGRHVFVANTSESLERQASLLQRMLEMRVDGLIISAASGTTADAFQAYAQSGVPVVQVLRRFAPQAYDYAGTNNLSGMRHATEQALALGHRRIAFLGCSSATSVNQERLEGYRSALQAAGHGVHPELVRTCTQDLEGASRATLALLDLGQPPTAIVCFSDVIAFGATLALHRRELKPGHDVSVIGFDDIPWSCSWYPPLSTMAIAPREIGRDAATLLQQRSANPGIPPQTLIREAVWIERASTAPPLFL
jgi:LacI family transcriptional regulator